MRPRDNPFRTERLEQLPFQLDDVTWPDLWTRLDDLHYHAAIVGAHGTGKTTLLHELKAKLREAGWTTLCLRCDAEHRTLPADDLHTLPGAAIDRLIILLDGAEQLHPLAWWRFRRRSRRAAGLIITTHRPGRLPTLLECRTSPTLLADLAAQLLNRSDTTLRATAETLFHRHRGNLRDALRAWYDQLAEAPS